MPTYAYECTGCGHSFEAFQKISDSPLTRCDSCGAALKKLMFPVGISFKGPGFYVNDYAKKSGGGASESAPKAPDSAPAAEAKTETPAKESTATPTATTPKPAET